MSQNVLTHAVWSLVEGLADGGVEDAVVAPGSRSTPLALALFRHPGIRVHRHYDERSAGYFGLGLAEASGRPVALLSTSGTAAANFLPAVVEASLTDVPLVVLTADRPPELREVGASQTIDQRHLYGSHTRWFYECPLPEAGLVDRGAFRLAGLRAARWAMSAGRGPVHLNVPFREPLLIGARPERLPGIVPLPTAAVPLRVTLEAVAERLTGKRGVVVAGAENLRPAAPAVLSLAAALGWPVVADPLSNLRSKEAPVLAHYDAWLTAHDWARLSLDAVVRFGPPPLSKALAEGTAELPLTLIDRTRHFRDPRFAATAWLEVPDWNALLPLPTHGGVPSGWWGPGAFLDADRRAARALNEAIGDLPEQGARFEGALFAGLCGALSGYQAVLVGNSMPVRDLDAFSSGLGVPVFGQRGASGIDGVLSHGFGISAARGRTLVVVGDLSFFHDANGLLAGHLYQLPVTVLVINNAGGGIFSFLDQGAVLAPDEFEPLFGTPHALDFSAQARVYGLRYERVESVQQALAAIARNAAAIDTVVLEWPVATRQENLAFHREVKARARRAALGEEWPHAESRVR